jgi:hypothetical protein
MLESSDKDLNQLFISIFKDIKENMCIMNEIIANLAEN